MASTARGEGPNQAERLLTDAGWTVLENRAVDLGGVWLAGLSSQRAFQQRRGLRSTVIGLDDLPATLAETTGDAPIILMAHEPDIFPQLPDRVCLTLSGHMHGGQIRPFGRALYAPSRYGTRFAYGLYEDREKTLIVSGGLGCSGLPLRYGLPPEITLVDLVP